MECFEDRWVFSYFSVWSSIICLSVFNLQLLITLLIYSNLYDTYCSIVFGVWSSYTISLYHNWCSWVLLLHMARCTRHNRMWQSLSVTLAFPEYPSLLTNKIDYQNITEIFLILCCCWKKLIVPYRKSSNFKIMHKLQPMHIHVV